jgi:uncharacterized membrane protein YkvA (DUF1232 family)
LSATFVTVTVHAGGWHFSLEGLAAFGLALPTSAEHCLSRLRAHSLVFLGLRDPRKIVGSDATFEVQMSCERHSGGHGCVSMAGMIHSSVSLGWLDTAVVDTIIAMTILTVTKWVLVPIAFMALSWAVMIVLAKRLPPGSAKDLASFLPACATTLRKLRGHPSVPKSAKAAVVFALLWVLSPIDLIPEFIPVIGPLDDVVVVALCLRFAARRVPRQVLLDAWPAEPRIIERLIGPTSSS